jgi:uncharacterized protein YndB with AHSA1/START domain
MVAFNPELRHNQCAPKWLHNRRIEMNNYQRSFTVAATPAAVFAAVGTIEGLRAWWTRECEGNAAVGGTIHFRFGATYKDMRVESAEPGREVRWLCTRAHIDMDAFKRKDEWVGTEMVFRISDAGQGRTRLDFEHIGLVPSFECFIVCQRGWQQFMGSLQQYLETGTGQPYSTNNAVCTGSMERSEAA